MAEGPKSGAPFVSKLVTYRCEKIWFDVSVRRPTRRYRLWGRVRVVTRQPDMGDVIFSWRKIVQCFWVISAALRLFDSVEVLNLIEETYLVSIYGKKNFKRILSCLFGERRKV